MRGITGEAHLRRMRSHRNEADARASRTCTALPKCLFQHFSSRIIVNIAIACNHRRNQQEWDCSYWEE